MIGVNNSSLLYFRLKTVELDVAVRADPWQGRGRGKNYRRNFEIVWERGHLDTESEGERVEGIIQGAGGERAW